MIALLCTVALVVLSSLSFPSIPSFLELGLFMPDTETSGAGAVLDAVVAAVIVLPLDSVTLPYRSRSNQSSSGARQTSDAWLPIKEEEESAALCVCVATFSGRNLGERCIIDSSTKSLEWTG